MSHCLRCHDDLQEAGRDATVDPGEDHVVHATPVCLADRDNSGEGLVGEGEKAEHDEEEPAPLVVVRRGDFKDDRNEGDEVDDANCLGMKCNKGSSFGSCVGLNVRREGGGIEDTRNPTETRHCASKRRRDAVDRMVSGGSSTGNELGLSGSENKT